MVKEAVLISLNSYLTWLKIREHRRRDKDGGKAPRTGRRGPLPSLGAVLTP